MNWKSGGEAYLPYINQIEGEYGIPTDLLARIAYQECSWRSEVIFGPVTSSAGAVGMFQLMPHFFPQAGENWMNDCDTAAKYLVKLYNQFSDWQLAVAAYNWGPGNVHRHLEEGGVLPQETQNYIIQVFTDVPVRGSIYQTLEA